MEDYSSSSSSQPSPHYYSSPAPSRPNHIMSTPPPASPQNPSSAPLACRSQPPHHHHVSGHSRPYAHPGASPHLTFGKPKRNLKWLRWRCVLGASLIHFCLGSVHTLGNLLPYIVGYIRTKQSPPPTATYKDGLSVYAWAIISQGIGGFLGTMIEKKIGTRRTCLLGGFWMCLGLALCAVCTHESSLLLISYGVITALGCGLCYSVPLAAALKLSPPQDKGWVSGILFFARGFSICFMCPFQSFYLYASPNSYLSLPLIDLGFADPPASSFLAPEGSPAEDFPAFSAEAEPRSPDGERFLTDARVLHRLPSLFLVMAIGFAILQLVGAALLASPHQGEGEEAEVGPPEQQKLLYDDARGTSSGTQASRGSFFYSSFSASSSTSSLSSSLVLTPHDILSSVSFWLLFLMLFLSWQSLFFIQLTWKILPLNPAAETAASLRLLATAGTRGGGEDSPISGGALESFLSWLLGARAAVGLGGRNTSEGENPWAATGASWAFVNDHAMCVLGSLLGGLCCIGRILWGYIGDGMGYMRSTILMNALVAPCLFSLSTYGMQTPQLFASCMAIIHLCQGGVFSLFPSLTSELFGRKNVGPVFSLLFAARLAAVALASLWTNIALHYTSLHVVCCVLGTCHLLCIGATFFFHPTDAIPYRFPMYAS